LNDAQLLQLLLHKSIAYDTTAVLYGRNLTAACVAHLLLYSGVKDMRLPDSGLARLPLATGPEEPGPGITTFGSQFPTCTHYMMNFPQDRALLQRTETVLASIRTLDEFTGQTSGYSWDFKLQLYQRVGRHTRRPLGSFR
jgi:3-mercaptopyruvate sulfurtransferase SseA